MCVAGEQSMANRMFLVECQPFPSTAGFLLLHSTQCDFGLEMHQVCIRKMHCRCLCPKEVMAIVLMDSDISLIAEEIELLGSFQSLPEGLNRMLHEGFDILFWRSEEVLGCPSSQGVGDMAIQFCPVEI